MMIPCLCSFTVLRTFAVELPINKKRTRTLFHKESGSSTNCMANDSNFDRNPVRGCNYGSEGGAFLILGGCIFDVRGCSLMHNIKELQISIFSASNAIIFPFCCPILCWNRRTLSVQFRFQYLSASSSYSGWYAQGLPRSP